MPSPNFDTLPCEIKWHIFAYIPETHITCALTSVRLLSRINAIDLAPLLGLRCPPVTIMFNALGLAHFQWIANSTLAPYVTEMQFVDMYFLGHVLLFREEEMNRAKDRKGHIPPIMHVQRMPTYRCQGQNLDRLMRNRFVEPGVSGRNAKTQRLDELWRLWSVRDATKVEKAETMEEGEGLCESDIDVMAELMHRFPRIEKVGSCTVIKAMAVLCEHRDGPETPLESIYAPGPTSTCPQQYWSLSPISFQKKGIRNLTRICERLLPLEFGSKVTSLILTTTGAPWSENPSPPTSRISIHMILGSFPRLQRLEWAQRSGPDCRIRAPSCLDSERVTAHLAEALEGLPELQLKSVTLAPRAHVGDALRILRSQRSSLLHFDLAAPLLCWEHDDALVVLTEMLEMLQEWTEMRTLGLCINVESPDYYLRNQNPLYIGKLSEKALPRAKHLSLALAFFRAVESQDGAKRMAAWQRIVEKHYDALWVDYEAEKQRQKDMADKRKLDKELEMRMVMEERQAARLRRARRKQVEGLV